ncbi:MAG: dienelactone hydrolase family protein [Chloroflexi bacterium]|nr:dienelactone hydrolase family protein [Chloroflexota bacterium]
MGWRRIFWTLAVFLALSVLVIALTPQGRAGVKSLLFIPQILPSIPIHPQEWFTGDPIRQDISYPVPFGQGVADLYRPSNSGRHAAVLLFLGVNPAGRDDERVVNLANALARSGMVVMIPWSDTMTQKRVDPQEIDNLVAAFQYLRRLDSVDPKRVGMGGFCVGASLVTVAAQEPSIRDQVSFVNSFGGYYDAGGLIKTTVSRSAFYNDQIEPWQPDPLTVEVITRHLIEGLEDEPERQLLTRLFVAQEVGLALAPETLSPQALAVYKLLKGATLEDTEKLIESLPGATKKNLRRLSPSTNLESLKARILIMHDREDNLVPVGESRRLADALDNRGGVYYTEFSFFQHVDPTRRVSPVVFVREASKLFLHLYRILRDTT